MRYVKLCNMTKNLISDQRRLSGLTFVLFGFSAFYATNCKWFFSSIQHPYWDTLAFVFILLGFCLTAAGTVNLSGSRFIFTGTLILFNLVGAGIFLWKAHRYWAQPGLADVPGATVGNGIAWGEAVFPILGGFLGTNVTWVIVSVYLYRSRQFWPLQWSFLLVPTIWLIAMYIDGIHHGG